MSSTAWLRRQAVGWSLPSKLNPLDSTLAGLGFVQADPIRAPARAQDLILRQRVTGYRAGDLERRYASLDIDEDSLYAYGFMSRTLQRMLHPRFDRHSPDGVYVPTGRAAEVLAFVRERDVVHPRDLQAEFGHEPKTNGWGGVSSATTMALERLHHHGLLRVADRVAGVRRYQATAPVGEPAEPAEPADRLRALVLQVARIFAPVTEQTLSTAVSPVVRWTNVPVGKPGGRWVIRQLLADGALAGVQVRGTQYVWPADLVPVEGDSPARVRVLAPFDPVVWDRRRFDQLWEWEYRFEAYTPASKRVLGYYAMPLLWRDRVIGWANWEGDSANVGYVGAEPSGRSYKAALDAEIERLRRFLKG